METQMQQYNDLFTEEPNPSIAKLMMKFSGGLSKPELNSLVK